MSRDLEKSEAPSFHKLYGTGKSCQKCSSNDVTIRIWEAYDSPAKNVGGDIGPDNIVAAIVICSSCGHGQTVPRGEILKARQVA
jgi:hypothetical protein